MKQGYVLVPTSGVETGSWFGGEAYHRASQCPECKNPLLLLADIDCKIIRHKEESKLFHQIDRLPLYYCWHCDGAELSYVINDAKGIKVIKHHGKRIRSNSQWYKNYPNSFPRRPISLVPIDYSLAKLLELHHVVGSEWLSKEDNHAIRKGIAKLSQNSGLNSLDFNLHQLGGLLRLIQDHERIGCPNSRCELHRRFFKDGHMGYHMKELAVLYNDPVAGLPMVESLESLEDPARCNEWVQVIFWICEECLTITASNRCD